MARGGYRFFDTDAHVGPYVDVLEPYLTAEDKARLAGWEQYKATSRGGHVCTTKVSASISGGSILKRRTRHRQATWRASPA